MIFEIRLCRAPYKVRYFIVLTLDQLPIAMEIFVFDPQVIDGNAVVDAPLGVMIGAVDDILVTSAPQLCLTKTPPGQSVPIQMIELPIGTNAIAVELCPKVGDGETKWRFEVA